MKKLLLLTFLLTFVSTPAFADDKDILTEVYTITTKNHIEPTSVADIASLVIKHIKEIDNSITIANDANRISIYKNASSFKSFIKPAPDDMKGWIVLTDRIMKEVRKHSPEFKEREYDRLDVMFESAFKELDGSSKYYSQDFVEDNKESKIKHFYAKNLKDDILYIKIKDFNEDIKKDVKEAIMPYTQGIILDIRGNKGGMLSEALEVMKLFIDEGIIAVSKEKSTSSTNVFVADKGDIFIGRPIVILVDAGTASSAEVFAAGMQEQGRAKIVGTNTYGKGSVQTVFSLSNNAFLALSTSYLYTPSNKKIDKVGIMPDVCTSNVILINNPSPCPKEDRENEGDDIDIAIELIKESSPLD